MVDIDTALAKNKRPFVGMISPDRADFAGISMAGSKWIP
jgi:hypothetical protein